MAPAVCVARFCFEQKVVIRYHNIVICLTCSWIQTLYYILLNLENIEIEKKKKNRKPSFLIVLQWRQGDIWCWGVWWDRSSSFHLFASPGCSIGLSLPHPTPPLFSWCSQRRPVQSKDGGGDRCGRSDVGLRVHQPGFCGWWRWCANHRYLLCKLKSHVHPPIHINTFKWFHL